MVGGGGDDGGRGGAVPVGPDAGGAAAAPVPAHALSALTRELARAVRWAEAERDAAGERGMAETHLAEHGECRAVREWAAAMAGHSRERWLYFEELRLLWGEWLGRRIAVETADRVEREALAAVVRLAG